MSLCFSRFRLLIALGVGAALSSSAQQTIINSKPKDVDSDKANSFMDSSRRLNAGDYKAPRQFLAPGPSLPLPPPSYQGTWDSSAVDAANKRKNWTLLTPRQILGVQTPDEILGLDAQDDKKKLSLEEQFLLRQRQPWNGAGTNSGASALFLRDDANPFSNNNSQNDNRNDRSTTYSAFSPDSRQPDLNSSDSFRSLKKLLGNLDAGNVSPGGDQSQYQNQNSMWTSGFTQPTRPKVTQDQLDAMERFRALLEPQPALEKTAALPTYSSPAKTRSSSFFDPPPNVNPAGHTYNSVESDIMRPKGLTPLPGVTGPVIKPDENKRPAWKAKLPPWMSSGPQRYNP